MGYLLLSHSLFLDFIISLKNRWGYERKQLELKIQHRAQLFRNAR